MCALAIRLAVCFNGLMVGQGRDDFPTKLAQFWLRYRVPLILGVTSVVFILVSLTILIKSVQTSSPIRFSHSASPSGEASRQASGVVIDVAGAVVRPGVYRLPVGSRVEDAIAAAGGVSPDVDADRLAQVVNRAAKLSDGAKLYVPKKNDAASRTLPLPDFPNSPDYPHLVSVNAASQQELEALPGIGPATAKKIISGRPYTDLSELVAKKALGTALFEKLKNQLTL